MIIDLNADIGEGYDDLDIVPLVSSVSIACGAHAGDEVTMERSVAEAVRFGVAVGAHPGYPDREGFGRRAMAITSDELHASLVEQIGFLGTVAIRYGAGVAYVKPHGALYNSSADDPALARLIAESVRAADPSLRVIGLAGSASLTAASDAGLRSVAEAFADRRYLANGRLAPRSRDDALIVDPAEAAAQAVALATRKPVPTVEGPAIRVAAQTICVHADTPGAVEMADAVRRALISAGVDLRSHASD